MAKLQKGDEGLTSVAGKCFCRVYVLQSMVGRPYTINSFISPYRGKFMTTYFSPPHVFNFEKSKIMKEGRFIAGCCVAILVCTFLTGCITDTTVDLTKAPFDASTELTGATTGAISKLTDGTSQATTDLTEPTREFLSSTTPGAWFHSDGTLNPDHKRIAFLVMNFDNVQEDMAHGSGEYLVSLARLVGVPPNLQDTFLKSAQNQYGYIFEEGQTRPESLRRLIQALHINSYAS